MDLASLAIAIAGLVVAVGGFSIALYQIKKTRTAAERAQQAADAARGSLLKMISIVDLTQASGQIEQLKELHKNQEWSRALDRYTPLRQLLIAGRARLPKEKADLFHLAIQQLVVMEEEVRNALSEQRTLSERRFNRILLEMQQALDQARVELEQIQSNT